jgi:prepilin-type N-terminal cleavage/methylation domain-containing protein
MSSGRKSGITLIELVVVVSLVSILMVALGFSYYGWQGKYKVERSVKELYTDLMNTRARAMSRNRIHWVRLINATSYSAYDDTNPAPDGNGGNPEVGTDLELGSFPKTLEYDMDWRTTGAPSDDDIRFSRKGIAEVIGTICFFTDSDDTDKESDFNPDYDCIVVSATRINLGKLAKQDTDGGECKTYDSGTDNGCEAL